MDTVTSAQHLHNPQLWFYLKKASQRFGASKKSPLNSCRIVWSSQRKLDKLA